MCWTLTHDGSVEGIVKVLLVEQDDVGFFGSISELEVSTEVRNCDNFADDIDVTDDFISCKRDEDDGNSDIDDKDNCNDDGTGDNIRLITLEIIFGKKQGKGWCESKCLIH